MKLCARLCALFILASSLFVAGRAYADTTATSTITQIKVLGPGDKNHRLFHGAVWLEYDKSSTNYRWGGSHCGGASLTDSQVAMLFAAFRSKYNVTLDYKKHLYNKRTYRCVTGFTLSRS